MAEAHAGFDRIQFYGGYEPKPFDADTRRGPKGSPLLPAPASTE